MKVESRWNAVPLREAIVETQYGTSVKANEDGEGLPILRMGNITYGGSLDLTDLKHVVLAREDVDQYSVRRGDLLFNRTNSQDLVGKMGVWDRDESFAYAGYLIRVRVKPEVADPRFVAAWFNTPDMKALLRTRAKPSINMSNINATELLEFPLVLPPLGDQRRIASILDHVDALRAKRRHALTTLDALTQSIFLDLFGDPSLNPRGWPSSAVLSDVAEIASGITKGRRPGGQPTREVPYLAVSNVQDKALNLDTVKTIEATEEEIDALRLRVDDLLLTEGGDPDKLGRGTLWRAEISECIHQNHIFRVRLTSDHLHPLFLNWLVGSTRGKRYFLRSAKQTTGIASINKTQLSAFPLLTPPLKLQSEFAIRVGAVERMKVRHQDSMVKLDALFGSLQHRAFRGEL